MLHAFDFTTPCRNPYKHVVLAAQQSLEVIITLVADLTQAYLVSRLALYLALHLLLCVPYLFVGCRVRDVQSSRC